MHGERGGGTHHGHPTSNINQISILKLEPDQLEKQATEYDRSSPSDQLDEILYGTSHEHSLGRVQCDWGVDPGSAGRCVKRDEDEEDDKGDKTADREPEISLIRRRVLVPRQLRTRLGNIDPLCSLDDLENLEPNPPQPPHPPTRSQNKNHPPRRPTRRSHPPRRTTQPSRPSPHPEGIEKSPHGSMKGYTEEEEDTDEAVHEVESGVGGG